MHGRPAAGDGDGRSGRAAGAPQDCAESPERKESPVYGAYAVEVVDCSGIHEGPGNSIRALGAASLHSDRDEERTHDGDAGEVRRSDGPARPGEAIDARENLARRADRYEAPMGRAPGHIRD